MFLKFRESIPGIRNLFPCAVLVWFNEKVEFLPIIVDCVMLLNLLFDESVVT